MILIDEDVVLCPHCRTPVTDGVQQHWMSETRARAAGFTHCQRAGRRIGRGDYWGWACGDAHTCYATRMPAVPDPSQD